MLAKANSHKLAKYMKPKLNQNFPAGIKMEVLNADAVILLGITHALRFVLLQRLDQN